MKKPKNMKDKGAELERLVTYIPSKDMKILRGNKAESRSTSFSGYVASFIGRAIDAGIK